MSKKLTIAMAEYMDHSGTYFSCQALRLYQDMEDCEILVLDNAPGSADGEATKGYIQNASTKQLPIRYVPFEENTGTTQTRQRLFDLAEGEAVLVMDCHVMLAPNAIHHLKNYYANSSEEERKNLVTGPLIMDSLNFIQTHFECEWRDEMWGTWATAWRDPNGVLVVGRPNNAKIQIHEQKLELKRLNTDGPWTPTEIPWAGHQEHLRQAGFVVAGWGEDKEPFEVPAQGLGIFSAVKEHWLGFNPDFRSFGGEECYIHEKYRQAGRKTMCLPFLKWNHRFGRPGGPKYPITREGKMRNYILGFTELGLDLEPIRKHFVEEMGTPPRLWETAIKDPVNFNPLNNEHLRQHPNMGMGYEVKPRVSNLGMSLPADLDSFQTVAMHIQTIPRDLDKHGPKLIQLASECNTIAEFTKRRESTAFLLAGVTRKTRCNPEKCDKASCGTGCKSKEFNNTPALLISYQEERDSLLDDLKTTQARDNGRPVRYFDIPVSHEVVHPLEDQVDMVFIDTRHTGDRAKAELEMYAPKVNKYIVFHDTHSSGVVGEDGKPGIVMAIRQYMRDNPEWFICYHTGEQYGLTVMTKDQSLRPETPIRPWPKQNGVGTQVKASLSLLGVNPSATCSCNAIAREWDEKGPAWCREHIEEMIDRLKEQHTAQKSTLPFLRPAVKIMLKRCIRAAEKLEESGDVW